MTIFQPASPYSDAIIRPPCPHCRTRMMLVRIEPDRPDHDKRSFECSTCGHEHSEIVKFR